MHAAQAERGLTVAKAALLWHVTTSGPATQRTLSEVLYVTPRAITDFVDTLDAAGLVRRDRHPEDRRAVLITPSAAGRRLVRTMSEERDEFARQLFGAVPAAEVAAFTRTTDILSRRLQELLA